MNGDRAAFVDNNTNHAVPRLLAALEARGIPPESVDYAIVTHVHLDHCGGTAELLKHCPNATVLAHPKTVRRAVPSAAWGFARNAWCWWRGGASKAAGRWSTTAWRSRR